MNCPYMDCSHAVREGEQLCSGCRRILKICQKDNCRAANRFWASFCTSCGGPLSETSTNWQGFRGGVQRTCKTPAVTDKDVSTWKTELIAEIPPTAEGQAGTQWPSLLIYGDHILTCYPSGRISIFDIARRKGAGPPEFQDIELGQPLYASPALDRENLYAGAGDTLFVYSLPMLLDGGINSPKWTKKINCAGIHSIMPLGDCLAATVRRLDGLWEIGAVMGAAGNLPGDWRPIVSAPSLSAAAGNCLYAPGRPEDSRFYFFFFSWGGRQTLAHRVDVGTGDGSLKLSSYAMKISLAQKADPNSMPVSAVGNVVHLIAGDGCLYRFNAAAKIMQRLGNRSGLRDFAQLSPTSLIVFTGTDVFRLESGNRLGLESPYDAVSAPPVLMGESALVLGMAQGEVRICHPSRLSHEASLVVEHGRQVVAVAASRNIIAAVSDSGLAKAWLVL